MMCYNERKTDVDKREYEAFERDLDVSGINSINLQEDIKIINNQEEAFTCKKEIAKLKNNMAARKYRQKRKDNVSQVLERLEMSEKGRNKLQIENARLRAKNELLEK